MNIEPRTKLEAEIREFGKSIGITFPPLGDHPSNAKYSYEANILHELGHWAVVPDFMIGLWEFRFEHPSEMLKPGTIPNIGSFVSWYIKNRFPKKKITFDKNNTIVWRSNTGSIHHATITCFFDRLPIPDECGVQEWCFQVAKKLGWDTCLGRYSGSGSTYYFDFEDVFEDTSNASQLTRVGINISNNIFRPQITRITFKNDSWYGFQDKQLLWRVPLMNSTRMHRTGMRFESILDYRFTETAIYYPYSKIF